MRNVTYKDRKGRLFKVIMPDNAQDDHIEFGIFVGPPLLTALSLPRDVEVKLHNELYARGLFTKQDVIKRRNDVIGALQSALAIHVEKIVELYKEETK